MRLVPTLALVLALIGCSANSGVQTWRPAESAAAPVAFHGEFNASNSNVFLYADEARVITAKLHPWERRGTFFGQWDGRKLRAECERGKKWLEVCALYVDGELAVTLDFERG